MKITQQVPSAPASAAPPEIDRRSVDLEVFAWLAAIPAAALTLAAILVLGPPLGKVLFPTQTGDFWPSALWAVLPEPTEQARYLIALGGAVLVPLSVLVAARRRPRPIPFGPALAIAVQLALVGVLACGVLCELGVVKLGHGYFDATTMIVALLIGVAFVAVLSWQPALSRFRALLSNQSRSVRWGAAVIASVATVIWLLPAIQLDGTVANADPATIGNLLYTFDEGLSVLNGHTPLVNYVTQYGSLWPYLIAVPLHFSNASLGSFTACMAAITGISMLAIYGVLRRVARSPIGALALFLPFLATSFFLLEGTTIVRYSFADYFGVFPLRYAGPYLVAFLIARHLSGARPRLAIWIFLASGLTLLNNGDYGLPSLGASVIALVAAASPGTRTCRWWLKLLFEAVAGLIAAYVLVSIVTLARTGDLPDLGLLFKYAHVFALAGYYMAPMPWFGFWVVIYLTFAAALVVAAAMMCRGSEDRVAIGMLAWVGIFGLGIGSYYDGRSLPPVLIAAFSAWSLAVALLVAVIARGIAQDRRRVGPAQLALFVGFGLTVLSITQFPAPWESIQRLRTPSAVEGFQPVAETNFVAAHSRPGEPVALLLTLGQRISREAGVDDVMPYTGTLSMPTKPQLSETLQRLRDAGGTTVFLRTPEGWSELKPALERAGFRPVAASERGEIPGVLPPTRLIMFSDAAPPGSDQP